VDLRRGFFFLQEASKIRVVLSLYQHSPPSTSTGTTLLKLHCFQVQIKSIFISSQKRLKETSKAALHPSPRRLSKSSVVPGRKSSAAQHNRALASLPLPRQSFPSQSHLLCHPIFDSPSPIIIELLQPPANSQSREPPVLSAVSPRSLKSSTPRPRLCTFAIWTHRWFSRIIG
jgi:hypothetical protein